MKGWDKRIYFASMIKVDLLLVVQVVVDISNVIIHLGESTFMNLNLLNEAYLVDINFVKKNHFYHFGNPVLEFAS